jgi:hypothetical protein
LTVEAVQHGSFSGVALPKVYVPPEALQGEDVPSFALWHNEEFSQIEVHFSKALGVKEVYNVARVDYEVESEALVVRRVEVNGYLGLSFSSHRLGGTSEKGHVRFDFHRVDGRVESESRTIHLFRPFLVVRDVPQTIEVDIIRHSPANFVHVVNEGIGTVRVNIATEEGSDIVLKEPESMSELRKFIRQDVEAGLKDVASRYAEHADLLKRLVDFWILPIDLGDEKVLGTIRELSESLKRAAFKDEKFARAVAEALVGAVLKNLNQFNILDQLVDYVSSIPSRRILLSNPLDVLEIGTAPASLKIILQYTDLANNYYEPISIRTSIVAKSPGLLPIYKLIEWG